MKERPKVSGPRAANYSSGVGSVAGEVVLLRSIGTATDT